MAFEALLFVGVSRPVKVHSIEEIPSITVPEDTSVEINGKFSPVYLSSLCITQMITVDD